MWLARQRAAVGPDGAPLLVELIQDDHLRRGLENLFRVGVVQDDAGKPLRIAAGHRIVGECRGDLRDAKRRLVGHERGPTFWRERQLVFRPPVRRHRLRPVGLNGHVSSLGELPDPGESATWRGAGPLTWEIRVVYRAWLPIQRILHRLLRAHRRGVILAR